MDLRKKDVADLLTVSIQTIDKLIEEGAIPFYKLSGEYRFNRGEIENWLVDNLSKHKNSLPFGEAEGGVGPWQKFGLFRALNSGDVYQDIATLEKNEIITEAMHRISNKLTLNPEVVSNMLIEREELMSTAIGKGIAVPHTREFFLEGLSDGVVIVFPEEPIDWGALDGEKTHTLFFIFACDDKRHLNLLAKIAHLTSSEEALAFFKTKPSKQELLSYIKKWEEGFSHVGQTPQLINS